MTEVEYDVNAGSLIADCIFQPLAVQPKGFSHQPLQTVPVDCALYSPGYRKRNSGRLRFGAQQIDDRNVISIDALSRLEDVADFP